MKHYYPGCPDNPGEPAPWDLIETECPWCLHEIILWCEFQYRKYPKLAIYRLAEELV